jgi:hypothetical protein
MQADAGATSKQIGFQPLAGIDRKFGSFECESL